MLINVEECSYLSRWKKGARLWLKSMLASITRLIFIQDVIVGEDQKVKVSLILIKFHEMKNSYSSVTHSFNWLPSERFLRKCTRWECRVAWRLKINQILQPIQTNRENFQEEIQKYWGRNPKKSKEIQNKLKVHGVSAWLRDA